jgi:adenosine kinase
MASEAQIVLAGSVSFDHIMAYPGRFHPLITAQGGEDFRLWFEAATMHLHHGGVSANIAYTMALLGGHPRLFATVGPDFAPYGERLQSLGVDCRSVVVLPEVATARFFASTDAENNQIGSFYAGAMAYAGDYGLESLAPPRPDWVVISPNAPAGMARHIAECRRLAWPYIFDPSQQVAILGDEVLRDGILHAYALTCNEYEWDLIQHRTGLRIPDLMAGGVIFVHTLGEGGAMIYTPDESYPIPPYPPIQILNPTGAGDAFRGGLLRGLSLGLPWPVCGRMGALCGTYALEQIGTQEHSFSRAEFVARYRRLWEDGELLAALT